MISNEHWKFSEKKKRNSDIIFLDPPYDKGLIDEALQCILENNLCNDEALVICEKSNTEEITITDEKLEVIKENSME